MAGVNIVLVSVNIKHTEKGNLYIAKFVAKKSGGNLTSLNNRKATNSFVVSPIKLYGEIKSLVARVMEIGKAERIYTIEAS